MSFVDMEITRRQFAARYANVGRAMLGMLADMYGVDIDVAENWADAINREAEQEIAATGCKSVGGIEGAASATIAAPSNHSHSAVLDPEVSRSGARLTGAACTAAPGFSPSYPVGSRRGSGAAAIPPDAAAPE